MIHKIYTYTRRSGQEHIHDPESFPHSQEEQDHERDDPESLALLRSESMIHNSIGEKLYTHEKDRLTPAMTTSTAAGELLLVELMVILVCSTPTACNSVLWQIAPRPSMASKGLQQFHSQA
jgi:hypothetical protein